jgi:hypothetical protein
MPLFNRSPAAIQPPVWFWPEGCKLRGMAGDFTDFLTEVWQHQPIIIVLVVGGFILFVLVVIDTHRHRKKRKKERPETKRPH